ncbi:MAG: acyl-CoA dehydrogenase family protein [Pseudomonadota bacterium]
MTQSLIDPMELLLPVIVANRGEAEKNRQLSEDAYSAIRESGLLGMPISEAHGGLGTPLPEMLRLYEAIAYEDAAVSWVMWNAGLIGFYARYMPPALREELFAGRNKLICQSTIPAGELHQDGEKAVVHGRWPLMSGSPGADWAVLSCRLFKNGQPVLDETGMPEIAMAAIPRDAFKIIDTWHTSGLRGTGSHDIELEDATVPTHRVFSFANDLVITGPSDRLPIFACVSAIFAAQLLGLGNAVYDHALDRGTSLITPGPMPDPCDRPDYQIAIAKHGEALETAGERLHSKAETVWVRANDGSQPDPEATTALYAAGFQVIETVKSAVEQLHDLSGTSALYETSPIEKRMRDLRAMLRHIVAQPMMQADVGRVKLRLQPDWPLFFL